LIENHSTFNGSKNMRLIASEESGSFGNKRFILSRMLMMVYEDGTVMVVNDNINPTPYNLESREQMTSKLSQDTSGGVIATQSA
jgi:hypothetical protein